MPLISNKKIILFISAFCLLLMSFLMIYRYHLTTAHLAPAEDGFIFKAPREIKKFELASTLNQPFTEKNFYGHFTLLFFGFTHCSAICPATLQVLENVYAKLLNKFPTLQVVFISLDPDRDTIATLTTYLAKFHPAFIGATGKLATIRQLQSQFGIYAARDDVDQDDYQLQHTASILLVNPDGKWQGIYKLGSSTNALIDNISQGMMG